MSYTYEDPETGEVTVVGGTGEYAPSAPSESAEPISAPAPSPTPSEGEYVHRYVPGVGVMYLWQKADPTPEEEAAREEYPLVYGPPTPEEQQEALKEKMIEKSKEHLDFQVEYDPEKSMITATPTTKLVREDIERQIEEVKREHPYGTDFKYDPETKRITWKEKGLSKEQEAILGVAEWGRERYPGAGLLWGAIDPRTPLLDVKGHIGPFIISGKDWLAPYIEAAKEKTKDVPLGIGVGAITTTGVGVGTGVLAIPPVAVGVGSGALFLAGSKWLEEHYPTTKYEDFGVGVKHPTDITHPFDLPPVKTMDPVERELEEYKKFYERKRGESEYDWGTGGEVGFPGRYPSEIPMRHEKEILKDYGFGDELPVKWPTEKGYVRKHPFEHPGKYGHGYPYGYPEGYGHGYPYEHPYRHPYQFPHKYPYQHPHEYGYELEYLYDYKYSFKFPNLFAFPTLPWHKAKGPRRRRGEPKDWRKVRWINPFGTPEQLLGLKKAQKKKGKGRRTRKPKGEIDWLRL